MTLRQLMDNAEGETWFCVVTPDGEEHFFWNADYLGEHPDVMPELRPLLGRRFDEFELVVRKDPEEEDVFNADPVPMVWVPLIDDREIRRRAKFRKATREWNAQRPRNEDGE